MVDDARAADLGRHWEDGWNNHDVDTIMAPFAAHVVFSSPFVSRFTGDRAKTTVDGYDALRAYVEDALRRAPGVRYSIDGIYLGPETVALVYSFRVPGGPARTGVDLMRVDADGKVVEWRSHYGSDFVTERLGASPPPSRFGAV